MPFHQNPGPRQRATLALAGALACLASLGCTTAVDAATVARPFVANDKTCHPATPAQLAWLAGPAWPKFASSVRVCAVQQLLIASVWESVYYADKPDGALQVEMPLPRLFAADGRALGELPQNFPPTPRLNCSCASANGRPVCPARSACACSRPRPAATSPLRRCA